MFIEIKKTQFILLIILVNLLIPGANRKEAAASGMGPFNVPPMSLGEMFRETPHFVVPNDHKGGRIQLSSSLRWLNVWAYRMVSDPPYEWKNPPEDFPLEHGNFLVDMESFSLTHRISYIISDLICAEVSIPLVCQTGGFGDGFAEGIHKTLDIGHNNRNKWPRNEIHGYFFTQDGQLEDYSKDMDDIFLGNITIGGTYLVKQSLPNFGIRALFKLPTSTVDDTFDQNSIDLSFQASSTWNKNKFFGHHGFGITLYGASGLKAINLKKERFSIFSALEYSWSTTFSFVMQMVAASAVADYPELDKPTIEVILGFKKQLGSGILEFGFIENILYFDNSPDGGIHVGYTFSK
jgi:hypothetical protein